MDAGQGPAVHAGELVVVSGVRLPSDCTCVVDLFPHSHPHGETLDETESKRRLSEVTLVTEVDLQPAVSEDPDDLQRRAHLPHALVLATERRQAEIHRLDPGGGVARRQPLGGVPLHEVLPRGHEHGAQPERRGHQGPTGEIHIELGDLVTIDVEVWRDERRRHVGLRRQHRLDQFVATVASHERFKIDRLLARRTTNPWE